jgi:hypothetical protein
MLSWTDRVELRGIWAPDVPSTDAAEETPLLDRVTAEVAQGQTEAGPDPTSEAQESARPPTWPAFGAVTYDLSNGIRLDVLARTGNPFALLESTTLFGETTKGALVSLFGVADRGYNGAVFGTVCERRFSAQLLVRGMHLSAMEDLSFDRARIRLGGLREMLWHPQAGAIGMAPEEGERFERVLQLPGARIIFRLGWEALDGHHRSERERVGTAEIQLDEPLAFQQWMTEWVAPLQHFVVFATRERSQIEAFSAIVERESPKLFWKPNEPPKLKDHEVEIVRRQGTLPPDEQAGYRHVLFWLGELGDDTEGILDQWFQLYRRLDLSAVFLFSGLTTEMFVEQRLISLTSAAEGYHRADRSVKPLRPARHRELVSLMLDQCETNERDVYEDRLRHANSESQRERLRSLFASAAAVLPEVGGDIDRYVRELANTRDYYIHQDQRGKHVVGGLELHEALVRLGVVLQANLMLDLGIPSDSVKRALRRSYEGDPVLATS